MSNSGSVSMSHKDAVARDPETPPITGAIKVAATPVSCRRIAHGRHRQDPVEVLEISEKMKVLFHLEGAGTRVFFRRRRVNVSLAVYTHRRHLAKRRVEGTWLTARWIFRVVDAGRVLP